MTLFGYHVNTITDGERFGYGAGNDLWECLWYELIASLRR